MNIKCLTLFGKVDKTYEFFLTRTVSIECVDSPTVTVSRSPGALRNKRTEGDTRVPKLLER
jgi:hypothetical protein